MRQADGRRMALGFTQGNHAGRAGQFIGREMLRLYFDGNAQRITPALQFLQAIGLALRRTLGQWQAARTREDSAEINRPDAYCRAMLRRQGFNPCRTQMGPGRIERNVIINQQSHGVSFRQ